VLDALLGFGVVAEDDGEVGKEWIDRVGLWVNLGNDGRVEGECCGVVGTGYTWRWRGVPDEEGKMAD